ncbi:hypothetical protein DMN91_009071 [Ooceraea biroi]|uniref:Uncharacterized protein n=1 Tax=Ooceraea biroi TaxID=2015173 RepID=A0A3L8DE83_OOCBI|nr:putative leucine-rich repeat-containing protein DDB_G0290503 isoform X2 [Ooceraea biroi]RLU18714.1 hypothetical protein DMN91_009071 [Ooceraea biroi]
MIVSTILSSVTGFHRRHSHDGRNVDLRMETEVRSLKQELIRSQDALKAATKRCRELVKELDYRVVGHESERILRDQQLSRILRALLVLEARLKQEQKSIRQMLFEKDNVIRNQQLEIAMLRRYTKNYIKSKRERTTADVEVNANINKNLQNLDNLQKETMRENSIGKDIASLKCEIITRLNPVSGNLDELDRNGVKKTHSFAGSDISKASLTSSENTDASIITTTTEGSPSLLSTEGFCEGESTDVSPGSTLNKCSSRCTPTTVTDSENETTMILDEEDVLKKDGTTIKKRTSLRRAKNEKASKGPPEVIEVVNIARTESKDDGMDCNFVSEDEDSQDTRINQEKEREPIYVNACNETNERNLQQTELLRTEDDYSNNNSIDMDMETPELTVEDTSGNWYSDPDEDRLNDDVFRHSTYRPNSNHNSVLECVNQILLQDMEEEENPMLSVPRRFKHRGRIVRFQPARLSDIESVGSEMERRNSEESNPDNKDSSKDDEAAENETSASEDEFGMRIVQKDEPDDDPDSKDSKAIPLIIIEPKVDIEETRKVLTKPQTGSPPLKMERIEEKTCLQMSARGLTIARNLDYEDIESLPEVATATTSLTPPRTPPALPPKPQFRNNTLILKKIPSPSFLIDEKRQQDAGSSTDPTKRSILGLVSSSSSKTARSLNLEETKSSAKSLAKNSARGSARSSKAREEGGFWKNRFNHVRSSFQVRQKESDQTKSAAKVTNIVRHFEEFKIDPEEQTKDRTRPKERHVELEHNFDIRQNFEEFNLDECDLSDDPDRPEGDGSERLGHTIGHSNVSQNENGVTKDNNNVLSSSSSNGNSETSGSSGYDHFLEATGLSNKSILTPSRLLSNHKSMLKPKDVKYKSRIKATAVLERHGVQPTPGSNATTTHVRHWTGPFV